MGLKVFKLLMAGNERRDFFSNILGDCSVVLLWLCDFAFRLDFDLLL